MKVGAINLINSNVKISNKKAQISFSANIKPPLSNDTADILPPELSRLLKQRNGLIEQIKQSDYKEKTKGIFEEIINIQETANASETGKMTFNEFRSVIESEKMRPVREVFEYFDNNVYGFRKLKKESFIDGKNHTVEGGGALFLSKDKKLADEMMYLYPFYTKAKWNQKEAPDNVFLYCEMMGDSFHFDVEHLDEVKFDKNGFCADEYFEKYLPEQLEKAKQNYEASARPVLFLTKDLDSLIDKDKNTTENIAHMKFILNSSSPEYAVFFAGGAPNPMVNSTEKGILKSHRISERIDIDKYGIKEEHVQFLKKAQADLGSFVDKISRLFRGISREDEQNFVQTVDSLKQLDKINEEILAKYCNLDDMENMKNGFIEEYTALAKFKPAEPFVGTREFMSMLDLEGKEDRSACVQTFENIAVNQVKEVKEAKGTIREGEIKTAVESVKDEAQSAIKNIVNDTKDEVQNQIKQNTKRFSKNKAFAIVAVLLAFAGVGLFLFKKYFHKFFKKPNP